MKKDFLGNLRKKKIVVLMGGWSAERAISLKSGKTVQKALVSLGLKAVAIDVDKNILTRVKKIKPDICFIALHGCPGEDGTIQAILDLLKIPYTGSAVLASALGINKIFSKQIFAQHKIPIPRWEVVTSVIRPFGCPRSSVIGLKFPVVVKPAAQGSTIGVSIVCKKSELLPALKIAFKYGEEAIVEQYIKGKEITVGILGQQALPVIEIIPQRGSKFYDYRAKYAPGGSKHIIPARLPKTKLCQAQRLALKAHNALGCRGFSRVDMRVSTNEKIYVLEVNTIPGMTKTSLLPEAARFVGIDFPEMVVRILHASLKSQ